MVSEWVTFFLSMLCCQCLEGAMPGLTNSSVRDSISCYKMLSDHSAFLEAEEPMRRIGPYSDTEVQFRNQTQESSQEELEVTESGETAGGPTIYIEEACGEPRGQQLVVDFSPQAGDAEIEIRNQIYDPEDSSSLEVTSESEPGLVQARGDHMTRAQYRASRYANGSETEVVIKTHYPEYESSSTTSNIHDSSSTQNETTADKQDLQEPREKPASSPELITVNNQPTVAVAIVNQHPFKDLPVNAKGNQQVPLAAEQIWEFQSCFSSPVTNDSKHRNFNVKAEQISEHQQFVKKVMKLKSGNTVVSSCFYNLVDLKGTTLQYRMAVIRRTDPLWKYYKPEKPSIHNDSEVELKSHLYTFVNSSVEDVMVVQKEGEQRPQTNALVSPKIVRVPDKENNFPAVHITRNQDRV